MEAGCESFLHVSPSNSTVRSEGKPCSWWLCGQLRLSGRCCSVSTKLELVELSCVTSRCTVSLRCVSRCSGLSCRLNDSRCPVWAWSRGQNRGDSAYLRSEQQGMRSRVWLRCHVTTAEAGGGSRGARTSSWRSCSSQFNMTHFSLLQRWQCANNLDLRTTGNVSQINVAYIRVRRKTSNTGTHRGFKEQYVMHNQTGFRKNMFQNYSEMCSTLFINNLLNMLTWSCVSGSIWVQTLLCVWNGLWWKKSRITTLKSLNWQLSLLSLYKFQNLSMWSFKGQVHP